MIHRSQCSGFNLEALFMLYNVFLLVFRALLFIAHGYAEHAHRYVKFARLLCSELGCLVFSHDHGEFVMIVYLQYRTTWMTHS